MKMECFYALDAKAIYNLNVIKYSTSALIISVDLVQESKVFLEQVVLSLSLYLNHTNLFKIIQCLLLRKCSGE